MAKQEHQLVLDVRWSVLQAGINGQSAATAEKQESKWGKQMQQMMGSRDRRDPPEDHADGNGQVPQSEDHR